MNPMAFVTSLILSLLFVSPLTVLADDGPSTCYTPNGALTQFTGGSLQIPIQACPAGPDGQSTCCAQGDTCSGSNRLCYNGAGYIWRNFCTDPTWKSTSCSPLCRGTSQFDSGPVQMTACPDGTMCCGGNNTACCDAKQGQFPFTGVPINATVSSNHKSSSLSGGAIGGIAVGAVAAVLLAAVLVLLTLRFRSDRHNKNGAGGPGRGSQTMEYREHAGSLNATTPTATTMVPSLHSQPSFKGGHDVHHYAMDKSMTSQYHNDRPLPAVPRPSVPMNELQGSNSVNRVELSGRSPWDADNNEK